MSGCGDCKGDCSSKKSSHSCGDNCKCKPAHGKDPRRHKEDIRIYLAPPPLSVRPDPTPLTRWCQHTTSQKYKRYQCLTCIRAFVWAVPYEETERVIVEMKELGRVVAVERLESVLKERKYKEVNMQIKTEVEVNDTIDIFDCEIEAGELVDYIFDKEMDVEIMNVYLESLDGLHEIDLLDGLSEDAKSRLVELAQKITEEADAP